MLKKFAFLLLLISPQAIADDHLCSALHQKALLKLQSSENRIHIDNDQTGFLKSGTCWWFSRLERNFAYLATFDTTKKPLSESELEDRVWDLVKMRKAEIPGFSDLKSLSIAYPVLFKRVLNKFMAEDLLFNLSWVKPLG